MELSKLGIDSKGNLLDQKSKAAVPWEQNEEVKKMKEALLELEVLRAEKKKKKEEAKS